MSVDCTNLLSVAVTAILQLGAEAVPATDVAVWTRMGTLCPAAGITLMITQDTLAQGVRLGVLVPCVDALMNAVWCVNNDMARLHAGNEAYMPPWCQVVVNIT